MPDTPVAIKTLRDVAAILPLVEAIYNIIAHSAQEPKPYDIYSNTEAILDLVNSPTYGLVHITNRLEDIINQIATVETTLLTAIGTPQQAGSPVTLPSPAPSGYGGPSAYDVAVEVWGFPVGGTSPVAAGVLMGFAGSFATSVANNSVLAHFEAPWFWVFGQWDIHGQINALSDVPQPLLTTIHADDTVLTWLTREWPSLTWRDGFYSPGLIDADDPSGNGTWICRFSAADFAQIKADLGIVRPYGAPVWPGIANVTLLTPVALDTTWEVTVPCDGVIVEITSVPSWTGTFSFGGLISYRNIGGLAFLNDNGDAELAQTLGPQLCVYLPKSMSTSSGVAGRTATGVTGTATPFTINSA